MIILDILLYILVAFLISLLIGFLVWKKLDHYKLKNLKKFDQNQNFVIIGTGYSGILAAIKLKEMGLENFQIFEANNDIGGTWFANQYPGAECDIASHLYSYSFELNPNWQKMYPKQKELLEYLKGVIDKYSIKKHIQINRELTTANYNENTKKWELTLKNPQNNQTYNHICNFLISGSGGLNIPFTPSIPGQDIFKGEQMHSAKFNTSYDFSNKNVAVIGSAASAVQVCPSLSKTVKNLYIFQRTPNYVGRKFDWNYPQWLQLLFKIIPGLMTLHRYYLYGKYEKNYLAFKNDKGNEYGHKEMMKQILPQIQDLPLELQKKLVPTYQLGCKRILISDTYFRIFKQNNVQLIDKKISSIGSNFIQTEDGEKSEQIDVIIYATGFQVGKIAYDVLGKNKANLRDQWGDTPTAYLGSFVPNFPNLIILMGPGTGLGHNSYIYMLEGVMRYVSQTVEHIVKNQIQQFEIKDSTFAEDQKDLKKSNADSIWIRGNCKSWYKNESGILFALFNGFSYQYWWKCRIFNPLAFNFEQKKQ